jgi:hypothetical protein
MVYVMGSYCRSGLYEGRVYEDVINQLRMEPVSECNKDSYELSFLRKKRIFRSAKCF